MESPNAGVVFAIRAENDDPIRAALADGGFGTWHNAFGPRSHYSNAVMGTLADLLLIRDGDWITFFRDRQFRGLARARALHPGLPVVLEGWRDAGTLVGRGNQRALLESTEPDKEIPWVIPLETVVEVGTGVDSDVVLTGDASRSTRALPRFSGLNLVRLEADEVGAVAGAILRANQATARAARSPRTPWQVAAATARPVDTDRLVWRPGAVEPRTSEYVLEAWIADQLTRGTQPAAVFGNNWAYVGRQEAASPMKPREYSEFIDIFGYETVTLAPNLVPAISRYKVVEVKANPQTNGSVLHQTLKYVDWVAHHRTGGDYSMIDAYIVAPEFRAGFNRAFERSGRPQFRPPGRSPQSDTWLGLHLVRAEYGRGTVSLSDVTPS